jgi:uncharacterized lipoprotein YajG
MTPADEATFIALWQQGASYKAIAAALAVLLLAGCAQTWQAPAGTSPATQASDQAACEEEAQQAATVQVGTAAEAAVARQQTLSQCLEARGWRLRRQAR